MDKPIKFGLNIVNVRADCVVEFAHLAEQLGFESASSGEHVTFPQRPD